MNCANLLKCTRKYTWNYATLCKLITKKTLRYHISYLNSALWFFTSAYFQIYLEFTVNPLNPGLPEINDSNAGFHTTLLSIVENTSFGLAGLLAHRAWVVKGSGFPVVWVYTPGCIWQRGLPAWTVETVSSVLRAGADVCAVRRLRAVDRSVFWWFRIIHCY